MTAVPDDMLVEIWQYVDVHTLLVGVSLACRRYRTLVTSSARLWDHVLERDYPDIGEMFLRCRTVYHESDHRQKRARHRATSDECPSAFDAYAQYASVRWSDIVCLVSWTRARRWPVSTTSKETRIVEQRPVKHMKMSQMAAISQELASRNGTRPDFFLMVVPLLAYLRARPEHNSCVAIIGGNGNVMIPIARAFVADGYGVEVKHSDARGRITLRAFLDDDDAPKGSTVWWEAASTRWAPANNWWTADIAFVLYGDAEQRHSWGLRDASDAIDASAVIRLCSRVDQKTVFQCLGETARGAVLVKLR